ncbi:VWA domain-containing protein [Corynebacterium hansenii]|uniref:VWA domain-containing protein n=1 Tax=Corynebacterium hansenii TaxID=394964 RepID=A0ABV7ZQP8_9CORY|nr:VWA domain-containing protein [Corynebacterium hansenii]WJZ00001.1 von Willebrand factor type A domain protein [Corynebacterium hansenii]
MIGAFAHPWWLLGLLVPAAAAAAYVIIEKRKRRRSIAFGNFSVVADVSGPGRPWLRHAPVVALLTAVAVLAIALAGPLAETKVARNRATIMLVVDVSFSMSATDVQPDRLTTAKKAGKEFLDSLPDDLNVGLVTFAGRAQTPVMPTTDHDTVARALEGARLDSATATGDAIAAAQSAIVQFGEQVRGPEGPPPAAVVLLSDGKQTIPAELDDPRGAYTAADEAAKIGLPIHTISFGTRDGAITSGGQTVLVPNDDESLMEIARRTGGEFHAASSLDELRGVYGELTDEIGYELRRSENPRPWMIGAFALLLASAAASLFLGRRIP